MTNREWKHCPRLLATARQQIMGNCGGKESKFHAKGRSSSFGGCATFSRRMAVEAKFSNAGDYAPHYNRNRPPGPRLTLQNLGRPRKWAASTASAFYHYHIADLQGLTRCLGSRLGVTVMIGRKCASRNSVTRELTLFLTQEWMKRSCDLYHTSVPLLAVDNVAHPNPVESWLPTSKRRLGRSCSQCAEPLANECIYPQLTHCSRQGDIPCT